jgi:hypothetical protein
VPTRGRTPDPSRLTGIATDKDLILSAASELSPAAKALLLRRALLTYRAPQTGTGSSPRSASVSMISGSAAAVRRHEPYAP